MDERLTPGDEFAGFRIEAELGRGYVEGADLGAREKEEVAGRRFRTGMRHEDGTEVLVDYTPKEAADPGGACVSTATVDRPDGKPAVECVTKKLSVPGCENAACVIHYLQHGRAGYAVAVASNGDIPRARAIARRITLSLRPR